ncbi:MAG: hypothetical protein OMM_08575, partial [Candidatus Magnetoglobus multicellularis str. Araruama]
MKTIKSIIIMSCLLTLAVSAALSWPIPHTGQNKCYDNNREIPCPSKGEDYYGQDAQYVTNKRSYTKLDQNGQRRNNS